MRKIIVLVAVTALVAAACGGGGTASCEDVADDAIAAIQAVIDAVDDMSLEDMASSQEPPEFAEFERKGEELQQRAAELGCSDEEMSRLIEARIDRLEADGPVGKIVLDGIKSEAGEIFSN